MQNRAEIGKGKSGASLGFVGLGFSLKPSEKPLEVNKAI